MVRLGLSDMSNKIESTNKNIARQHKLKKHCRITRYAGYLDAKGKQKTSVKAPYPIVPTYGVHGHTLATSRRVSCGVNRRIVDNTRTRSGFNEFDQDVSYNHVKQNHTLISLCSRN